MGIIRTGAFALAGVAALAVGGFAALGQYSKRGSAPGRVDGMLAPCPDSPNCVSSEAGTASDKRVAPFARDAWEALPGAIAAMGGAVTRQEPDYIAAEFTSKTFGFVTISNCAGARTRCMCARPRGWAIRTAARTRPASRSCGRGSAASQLGRTSAAYLSTSL